LATLALAIALNLVLIPVLGMLGAALAALIAGLGNFLGFFVGNQLTYRIPAEYRRILTGTALCLILSLVAAQWLPEGAYALRISVTIAGLLLLLAPLVSPWEAARLLTAAMSEIRQRLGVT